MPLLDRRCWEGFAVSQSPARGLLEVLQRVPDPRGRYGKRHPLSALLAAVGAVNIVISLYYYLLVVKRLYMWEAKDPRPVPVAPVARWPLAASMAAVVVIGVYPSPFLEWSLTAACVFF